MDGDRDRGWRPRYHDDHRGRGRDVLCVIDLVAAVGLWLAASWGGVVWLVAVAVQWLAIMILPSFFDHDVLTGLVDLVLVATYLAVTYLAAQEAGD